MLTPDEIAEFRADFGRRLDPRKPGRLMRFVGGPLDGLRTRVENPLAYCIGWCHWTRRGVYQAFYRPRAGVLQFDACQRTDEAMGIGR